jgi:hypothetical protein
MTFKTGGKLLSTLQEPTPTTIFNLLEHRVFSSWKSGLHDIFRCHSYIWLFIQIEILQSQFD